MPNIMRHKVWMLSGLTVALASGALFWAFMPKPIPVEVAEARRARFEQTIDEDGKTRVRERYVVSAPLAGRLARVQLEPGDVVAAGATIATLLPSVPALLDDRATRELEERVGATDAALAAASANVARAEASLDQAKLDLSRNQKLAVEKFLSPATLDQSALNVRLQTKSLEAAQSERHGAEHNLAQARAALTRAREERSGKLGKQSPWPITAPVTGRVLKVLQKSAAVVTMGTPLIEIGDPGHLEIVVDVLSTEATRIPSKAQVRIDSGGGHEHQGVVRYIEPAAFTKVSALGVEEQRVNVIIDFAAPAVPQALGDGYRVDVRIVTLARADVTTVPVGALFRSGDTWGVFAIAGGRAEQRRVKVGGRSAIDAWIEEGIVPGEQVIVYPSDRLADGRSVAIVRRAQ